MSAEKTMPEQERLRAELLQEIRPELGDKASVTEILSFAHNAFPHDSWNAPDSLDPFTILEEARAGKSMRCVEYSLLASALLNAYGTPARVVAGLALDPNTPGEFSGHVFIEYWDVSDKKWIMHDPQWGITPISKGTPTSAVQLRNAFDKGENIDFVRLPTTRADAVNADYAAWVKPYMDIFDTVGVTSFTHHKTMQEHVSEFRTRLPRNQEIAEQAKGMGSLNISCITAQEFYTSPQ